MEMTSYPAGMPSWVDIGVPDMDDAIAFYGGLFGWTFDEPGDDATTGGYRQARLDGASVAGFGPQQAPGPPFWATYIATDSVEATAEKVTAAGGSIVLPAMDIPGVGRMGVFTDDTGTFFSVWQAGGHPGAARCNEPGALTWNELMTRQPEQAKAFYAAVFGWGVRDDSGDEHGPYAEWQLDGRSIGGMMPMIGDQWPPEVPNNWLVYFGVEDTDAACARATELGGTVTVPPFDTPAGRCAVIADRAGAIFSIIALAHEPVPLT